MFALIANIGLISYDLTAQSSEAVTNKDLFTILAPILLSDLIIDIIVSGIFMFFLQKHFERIIRFKEKQDEHIEKTRLKFLTILQDINALTVKYSIVRKNNADSQTQKDLLFELNQLVIDMKTYYSSNNGDLSFISSAYELLCDEWNEIARTLNMDSESNINDLFLKFCDNLSECLSLVRDRTYNPAK